MLGLVIGGLGTGKTMYLTLLAALHPGPVYANYHIRHPNCTLLQEPTELEHITSGLVLLDEAYMWLESRCSTSKLNRYITHLLMQSRKRNWDIFMSTQLLGMLDVRARHLADAVIIAQGAQRDGFHYDIITQHGSCHMVITWNIAQRIWELYDTRELPSEPKSNINKKVDYLAKKIAKSLRSNRITKSLVADALLEEGEDTALCDLVYARIIRKYKH